MTTCAPETLDEAVAGAILTMLSDSLAIHHLTRTPDSSGGTTEGYAADPALSDVPCLVYPSGGGELILADRLGLVDTYTILIPYATALEPTDRIVSHGLTFEVQYVPKANSTPGVTRVVATVVA